MFHRNISTILTVFGLLILGLLFPISAEPLNQETILERSTSDRADDSTDYQVHVIYVLPSDGADENLDTNGELALSVASFQNWLEEQTGGSQLRMDTFEGNLDVTFWRLGKSDLVMAEYGLFIRDQIEAELIAAGFNDPRKVYAVYYDGSAVDTCGGGAWPPQLMGTVAAIYLNGKFADPSIPLCSDNPFAASEDEIGYIEFSMLREILHTLGIVASCAPNHTERGHVSDDPHDLMYAGHEFWEPTILDIGYDDYYKHDNPDCVDLADSVFLEPMPANAVRPPGWPELVLPTMTPAAISTESSIGVEICSEAAETDVTVTFVNNTTQTVELLWINYECEAVSYGTLPPGTMVAQPTYVSHPWRVRSVSTGMIMAETVPDSSEPYTVSIEE